MATASSPFLERAPDEWVASNSLAFAIRDAFPVSPGHTLVVPRRLFSSWFDATAEERAAILELVDVVRRQLDASDRSPQGYNIGINVGAAAGQTVPHLHVHVIPRYDGDVPDPRGGVRHVIPGKGNYLAVERGDDTTESLSLDTRDLAEKFVSLYWRQVLPWVHGMSGAAGRLHQATGAAAAILNRVGAAHERYEGSLTRFWSLTTSCPGRATRSTSGRTTCLPTRAATGRRPTGWPRLIT